MNNPFNPFFTRIAQMAILCAASLAAGAGFARAEDPLAEGMTRLAAKVSQFVQEEGGDQSVLVGDFTAPPRLKASGGAGISQLLAAALKKQGIEIKDKGTYQLVGLFTVRDEKANETDTFDSVALRISATLMDRNDNELKRLNISVFGDISNQIAGNNIEQPPGLNEEQRQALARKGLETPQAAFVNAETRGAANSPFGVEVIVRSGPTSPAAPRKPVNVEGRSFVDFNRGEEYVVRLHNRSPLEAAVTLTIDGLNMFAFSEEGNFGSQVLILPGKFVDVPGWYINKSRSDGFEITSYAKSAASSIGKPATQVGTITASFSAAWDPSVEPPADEINPKGADDATGRGRPLDQRYELVKRVTGRVRSVVSVRYLR